LTGNNPRKVVFLEVRKKDINSDGEMIDPWQTAYRIGITSDQFPWAYSFGKNRIDEGGNIGSDDIVSWNR
jgi:hypothetical protein